MNPVADIKEGAKSAFKIRYVVGVIVGLFIINVILELTKLGPWYWTPLARLKAWNEARKAKA